MTTIINTVSIPNEQITLVKFRIISAIKRLIQDHRYEDSFFEGRELDYDNEKVYMTMDNVAMRIIEHTLGPDSVFNEMEDKLLTPQQLWDELYSYEYVEYEFVWMFAEYMVPDIKKIPGAFLWKPPSK